MYTERIGQFVTKEALNSQIAEKGHSILQIAAFPILTFLIWILVCILVPRPLSVTQVRRTHADGSKKTVCY